MNVVLMRRILMLFFTMLLAAAAFAETRLWEPLRPATQLAQEMDFPVKVIVFLLALCIFGVSLLAFSKSKSKRILLVSFAFLLFALKWLVKIIDLVYSPGSFLSDASENIFELGILLSLLVALFYRKSWGKFFEKEPR